MSSPPSWSTTAIGNNDAMQDNIYSRTGTWSRPSCPEKSFFQKICFSMEEKHKTFLREWNADILFHTTRGGRSSIPVRMVTWTWYLVYDDIMIITIIMFAFGWRKAPPAPVCFWCVCRWDGVFNSRERFRILSGSKREWMLCWRWFFSNFRLPKN